MRFNVRVCAALVGAAAAFFLAGCNAFRTTDRPGGNGTTTPPPAEDCPAGTGNTLAFTWNAPVKKDGVTVDTSVQGYNFYYGRESGRYTIVEGAPNTAHVVSPLGTGAYYFAVTAYNQSGESGYSNEVLWTGTSCPSLRKGDVQYLTLGKGNLKSSRPPNIKFDGKSFSFESGTPQKEEKP